MLPVNENAALRVTNPYGRTKLIIEDILRDLYASDKDFWRIMILRYTRKPLLSLRTVNVIVVLLLPLPFLSHVLLLSSLQMCLYFT